MKDQRFVFIAGLHRSGKSLLNEIIRTQPGVSGLSGTGVIKDEGQHLQDVYPAASVYGGPGKFAFHPDAYMDEMHPLATDSSAQQLYKQWGKYFDLSQGLLLDLPVI